MAQDLLEFVAGMPEQDKIELMKRIGQMVGKCVSEEEKESSVDDGNQPFIAMQFLRSLDKQGRDLFLSQALYEPKEELGFRNGIEAGMKVTINFENRFTQAPECLQEVYVESSGKNRLVLLLDPTKKPEKRERRNGKALSRKPKSAKSKTSA